MGALTQDGVGAVLGGVQQERHLARAGVVRVLQQLHEDARPVRVVLDDVLQPRRQRLALRRMYQLSLFRCI